MVPLQVLGASCDSKFSHLAWIQTDRKAGGLGDLTYPLIADIRKTMARDYNVLIESEVLVRPMTQRSTVVADRI